MWTDPGWFIYLLEVWIWFWSLAAWPLTFLYLSFSTLYSSCLWRTDTVIFSKLIKPRSFSNKPGGLDRGFTVIKLSCSFYSKDCCPQCLRKLLKITWCPWHGGPLYRLWPAAKHQHSKKKMVSCISCQHAQHRKGECSQGGKIKHYMDNSVS